MNKLVIIGAGGQGNVVADIAEKNGYTDIIFLDDNPKAEVCGKYKIVGKCNSATAHKDGDFIVAIGNARVRRMIQTELADLGLRVVSLVHPSAVIAPNVRIGTGTVVVAGAVINSNAEIGEGCIINTCASVDHDCRVGDYVHVSVGARVAGTVTIGSNTMVGAGAVIINNINIADGCVIGAGATVVKNITELGTYVGTPARKTAYLRRD